MFDNVESPLCRLDKSAPYRSGGSEDILWVKGWNVLDERLHFPLLLIRESSLAHNLKAMADWCARAAFLFAPHGKTTMCPQIFRRQIEHGAWGITVATVSQAAVCVLAGVKRILLANQVVGRANLLSLAEIIRAHADVELLCLVDSKEGIAALREVWETTKPGRAFDVLLEFGRTGWRSGVRSAQHALDLHAAIAAQGGALRFRGVEAFEGLTHGSDEVDEGQQVQDFFHALAVTAGQLARLQPDSAEALICSVGGSAFLDCVWRLGKTLRGAFQLVIRSGCYVTHDHGYYAEKYAASLRRDAGMAGLPQFMPALELWSHVQSVPEDGLAILNFGKRDSSYDLGLPIPISARRSRGLKHTPLLKATITHCNDQHAFLQDESAELRVGDQVCCGISHPCTAFDKWRSIPLVDDGYNILDIYRTYF